MGSTWVRETSDRNLVVDSLRRLSAHLAFTAREVPCQCPSGFPPHASCIAPTTSPARVGSLANIFGLPFSPTKIITKDILTMKISDRTGNRLAAPSTGLCCSIRPTRISSTEFTFLGTIPGAILLVSSPCAYGWVSTHETPIRNMFPPPMSQITIIRTKLLSCFSILRMKRRQTLLTIQHYIEVPHNSIIPHIEIEERYCAIAAKRMAQGVLI